MPAIITSIDRNTKPIEVEKAYEINAMKHPYANPNGEPVNYKLESSNDVSAHDERAWNPTPTQFENYKNREIELARHNIKRINSKNNCTSVSQLRQLTLHSEQSIVAALKSF